MFKKLFLFIIIICFGLNVSAQDNTTTKTQLILLGTGTPYPSPTTSGPATAVVYGKRVFLFDAGTGVMRRMNAAKLPISGPEATFITHLHSDHTLGYSDLILTSWIMRRKKHLEVFGPHGLKRMTDLTLAAFSEDIKIRIEGLEKELPEVYKVNVHEIYPGIVYDSSKVKITSFPVLHGNWKEAYGFRIDTPGRSIVISGDTRPCKSLIEASKNVDILVHEVYSEKHLAPENRPGGEFWPQYCREFHTSDVELGKIAKEINPKLLVLTHIIRMGATDKELIEGIRKGGYNGKIVIGKDLESFSTVDIPSDRTSKESSIGKQIKLKTKGINLPNKIAKKLYREIITNGDVEEERIIQYKNNPSKIFIANEVDLNSDGVPEIIVTQSGENFWCISHNCPIWIYKKDGTKYTRILGGNFAAYEFLEETENGYHNFATIGHSSAAESYIYIYSFDKTGYKKQKCVKQTYSRGKGGKVNVKYGECE